MIRSSRIWFLLKRKTLRRENSTIMRFLIEKGLSRSTLRLQSLQDLRIEASSQIKSRHHLNRTIILTCLITTNRVSNQMLSNKTSSHHQKLSWQCLRDQSWGWTQWLRRSQRSWSTWIISYILLRNYLSQIRSWSKSARHHHSTHPSQICGRQSCSTTWVLTTRQRRESEGRWRRVGRSLTAINLTKISSILGLSMATLASLSITRVRVARQNRDSWGRTTQLIRDSCPRTSHQTVFLSSMSLPRLSITYRSLSLMRQETSKTVSTRSILCSCLRLSVLTDHLLLAMTLTSFQLPSLRASKSSSTTSLRSAILKISQS